MLRKTLTTFQTFSSALPNHGTITNAPSSVVIENGGGTHVAETDYLYDGGSTGTAAAIQHDTNYPSGSGLPRGNPTTKTQQCFAGSTNCQNAVTTYSYDETGQVISVKDACGNGTCSDMSTMASIPHTTTYLYADSYSSGTPPVSYTHLPSAVSCRKPRFQRRLRAKSKSLWSYDSETRLSLIHI